MIGTDAWVWGRLTPLHRAQAEFVAKAQMEVAKERALEQTRGTHPNGEFWQKRVGAESEIAFHVLSGRPVPSVGAMLSSWRGPDSGQWSIKGITDPHYNLIFHNDDLVPGVDAFVVVYNDYPRVAIVGWIPIERAVVQMVWGHWLPRPCWAVDQGLLDDWKGGL